jgi:hypothetical protein
MIGNRWRRRLTYLVMSAFVAWHTLAMVVAPASGDSVAAQSLRQILDPYLAAFRLDNPWDFYAPIVGAGQELRYVVEGADGGHFSFVPTSGLKSWHPHYWWYRAWYNAIIETPEVYGDYFAILQCRKYTSLHPISIDLVKVEQKHFSREDFLNGKNPMDSEFLTEDIFRSVRCPQG